LNDLVLIAGGLVLAADGSVSLSDILLQGSTIAALVEPGTATSEHAARIDARRRLVMPGLVNAHTHGHGALAKGLGDRITLELLLNASAGFHGQRTDEDRRLSATLNAVEMLRKGCTACFDLALTLPGPDASSLFATAQAYADVGMRAVVAPMIADRTLYEAIPGLLAALPPEARPDARPWAEALRTAPPDAIFAEIESGARTWPFDRAKVRLGIGPTIPLHCSDAFLRRCTALSTRFDLPLQTHLAESAMQRAAGIARYGTSLTRHLDDIGLLRPGVSVAHGIFLDDEDLDILAARGVSIAHNPGANLRLGSGIADITAARDRGITIGVGTDGSSSSDNQNMFEAMRLAAYVSRVFDRPTNRWIGARDAIAMATVGSAAVLGMAGTIGRIAPGYQADLVFLDRDHVNLVPLNDAANQLVNTEDGSAVREVMVGGRIVLSDGKIHGIDWPSLVDRAQRRAEQLAALTAPARMIADRLAPVVEAFCAGLGCAHHHSHKVHRERPDIARSVVR
jgi:5-methylthioadenosine/S-adenosylhomocysteine deaminase